MTDKPLRPATREEVCDTLRYALCFSRNGKPHRHAGGYMAQIAADVLAEHLELSGFVILKKPPAPPLRAPMPDHKIKLKD